MPYQEYDVTIEYQEGDIASFNGVNKALHRNPLNRKLEWLALPHLDIENNCDKRKPSLMAMLKEYYDLFESSPGEIEQRFMIEQYKTEFDHWSKSN